MTNFVKDPDAILDYSIDWSNWLGNDTIDTSTWVAESPLIIISASDVIDATNTITTVFVSGGVVNNKYNLTNHIITAGGREDDRTITIIIKEK